MSREILFKAKRKNWRELPKEEWWVEGLLQKMWGWLHIINSDDENKAYPIDPETICQYTGLTDKDGKRIWENDIVGFIDITSTDSGYRERDCIGKVGWEDEELCFYVTGRLSAKSWEVLQDCVVLGNIFDNPELLKGG